MMDVKLTNVKEELPLQGVVRNLRNFMAKLFITIGHDSVSGSYA
jgi:hypothetical protein